MRRLALVGDAQRHEVGRLQRRLVEGALHDLLDVAPDLLGVVLDPARAREDLLVLLLGDGDDAGRAVEDHAARGRRALVDRRHVLLAHRHARVYQGIAPSSRETARAASRTNATRSPRGWRAASRRSGGPETPIAPTVTPAAVEDRRRARHLAVDELADVGRPAALAHALELALQRVGVGDGGRREALQARSRDLGRPRRGGGRAGSCPARWRGRAAAPRRRASAGCRRGGRRGGRSSTWPSCSVPMRTLSCVRAASESDQFSARVRSSLPSR